MFLGSFIVVGGRLRALAYSTLADLAHHVRARLGLGQLGRVIAIFGRNLHDPTLSCAIQQTSTCLTCLLPRP